MEETGTSLAKESTDPKETYLTRFNALKQNILTGGILLEGEDGEEFQRFGGDLRKQLAPDGEMEKVLVDRIVSSTWRLGRVLRIERDYIQSEFEYYKHTECWNEKREDKKAWNLVTKAGLGSECTWLNLLRNETAIETQIYRALDELIRLQSARRREIPRLPVSSDDEIRSVHGLITLCDKVLSFGDDNGVATHTPATDSMKPTTPKSSEAAM